MPLAHSAFGPFHIVHLQFTPNRDGAACKPRALSQPLFFLHSNVPSSDILQPQSRHYALGWGLHPKFLLCGIPTLFPSSLNSYDCHSLSSHAWSHLIVLHNTFINLRTIKCTSFEGWKSICILSQSSLLCACSKFPSHLSACLHVALVLPCTLI